MKAHDLLQKPLAREAELYQAAKLWQLLPQAPNEVWPEIPQLTAGQPDAELVHA